MDAGWQARQKPAPGSVPPSGAPAPLGHRQQRGPKTAAGTFRDSRSGRHSASPHRVITINTYRKLQQEVSETGAALL